MRFLFLSMFTLLSMDVANCQEHKPDSAAMPAAVIQGATKMAGFLLERDAKALINSMPPKLITEIGSNEKFIEAMKKGWRQQDSSGLTLIADSIGDPSRVIFHNKTYQCTVPQIMKWSNKYGTKYLVQYLLIAISYDGEKWYFIDTKGDWNNINKIYRKFPELSTELSFPEELKVQKLDD
jgi:hypothetical protein